MFCYNFFKFATFNIKAIADTPGVAADTAISSSHCDRQFTH